MSFKGPEEIAIITSTINAHTSTEVPYNFLILLIENLFGDDNEVIFQSDNVTEQQELKLFFSKGI